MTVDINDGRYSTDAGWFSVSDEQNGNCSQYHYRTHAYKRALFIVFLF
jgi:hypothetical protein